LLTGIKAQVLKNSLIFSSLNDEEIAEFAGLAVERSFQSGEFIFWDGDAPDWFYMVAEGRVKVLKHSSLGKEGSTSISVKLCPRSLD
jgi:CRP-like cAMP-binding protein